MPQKVAMFPLYEYLSRLPPSRTLLRITSSIILHTHECNIMLHPLPTSCSTELRNKLVAALHWKIWLVERFDLCSTTHSRIGKKLMMADKDRSLKTDFMVFWASGKRAYAGSIFGPKNNHLGYQETAKMCSS